MIYFDNAATSFPKPEIVYESIMRVMREYGANPGRSGHGLALRLGREIYQTRELLAGLFNIDDPMNIIFTHNGTESLNLGIKGILKKGDHVITSSMEHNSVLRPLKALEREGIQLTIVEGDSKGRIDPRDIEENIRPNTRLIAITHISNLTGTIMPIEEIGSIARKHDIYYLLDAAQSAGVYNIDIKANHIDLLAMPGHKGLLGPQGTGILYIGENIDLKEIKQGGTGSTSHLLDQPDLSPDRYESGTPNGPGIVGLGTGVKYILDKGIDKIRKHEEELTMYFIEELKKINDVKIYGPMNIEEQAPVVAINIGDRDSSEISYILDSEYNIAVRPGLHCTPAAHKTIGSFRQGAVRFSFGLFNTMEEVETGIKAIRKISKEM